LNEIQAGRIIRIADQIKDQIKFMMGLTTGTTEDDFMYLARLLGALEENLKQLRTKDGLGTYQSKADKE